MIALTPIKAAMSFVFPYFRKSYSVGFTSIAVFALAGMPYGDDGWNRNLAKNGITIETRSVAGSPYKEFKATMVVKSSLGKAIAVMEDIPGYTRWMKDCKEARVLSKLSPNSGIIYSLQATPGRVRISRLRGHWQFLEIEPGSVEVTYVLHSEPGGSLPAWAVAGMVAHLPYETLNKLRAQLEN